MNSWLIFQRLAKNRKLMISATNIFVKYGDRVLLDKVTLVVQISDRIGLVGRNGAGKSTLLKL